MTDRNLDFPFKSGRTAPARGSDRACLLAVAMAFLFLSAPTGCRKSIESDSVSMYARAASTRDLRILEIQAQVRGSQENLRYRWLSGEGQCDPQESRDPVTIFRFAEGSDVDRVTLSVWQNGQRVGESQLEVRAVNTSEPVAPDLRIEIVDVPLAETGGSETRTNIAGRVVGQIPKNCRVLVYARDEGVWYLQPMAFSKLEIDASGGWSTWCHKGSRYAAVLVHNDFMPFPTLDQIPRIRGNILARVVVDGRAK